MDKELKEMLSSPIFLYTIAVVCSVFFIAVVVDGYVNYGIDDPLDYDIDLDNLYESFNIVENKYQGSVPIGYNLEYFRETGKTVLEVDNG